MDIISGDTTKYIYFVAKDATDLQTRKTGLSAFTVYRARNGGAATAYTTPTIAEVSAANMPGLYTLLADEDTTLTAGNDFEEYAVHITCATMAPVTRTVNLVRPKITTGNTLDVTATGAAGIDWANVENPTTTLDLSATTISAAGIATAVWNAATVTYGSAGSYGLLIETNLDATSSGMAAAVWDLDATAHQTQGTFGQVLGDSTSTATSVWGLCNTNLNGTITSRMASYTQPTGFLAATFPTTVSSYAGGAVASVTGGVTVTTNNDKTGYTVSTVSDKTGYSLSQAFPTNFSSLSITAGGAVTAGTVSDKTGYALTQAFPANFSAMGISAGGVVNVDVKYMNAAAMLGDGTAGNLWRGA